MMDTSNLNQIHCIYNRTEWIICFYKTYYMVVTEQKVNRKKLPVVELLKINKKIYNFQRSEKECVNQCFTCMQMIFPRQI